MSSCYMHMQPGYLHAQLPTQAPVDGESWPAIMRDVEDKILPGEASSATWCFCMAHQLQLSDTFKHKCCHVLAITHASSSHSSSTLLTPCTASAVYAMSLQCYTQRVMQGRSVLVPMQLC